YTWPPSSSLSGVVDNSDAGFTVVSGTWTTGTSATDKYGADYRYKTTGTGSAVVRWTPSLANTGNYDVYVWYPQGTNRPNNAPYTVNFTGGSQAFLVDQTTNGGKWNLLGTFYFQSGTGSIELSDNAQASKAVMADAVRFAWSATQPTATPTRTPTQTPTYTPVAGIFVDDGDSGYSSGGTWSYVSAGGTQPYNGDYYWADSNPSSESAWAKWTPNLPARRIYEVYVMFRSGSNRPTNAPYTVYYSGGSQTVTVNQTINGGVWVLLGSYIFDAGTAGYVRLSNYPIDAGKAVIADAVRWLDVGAAPTNTPTNTPTRTPTNTPTRTPTNTPTNTPTRTPTNTPTRTPTNTPTNTPTPAVTPVERILDDGDSGYTKSSGWTYVSAGGTEPLNGDYDWASTVTGSPTRWAKWTPNLTAAGNYSVYVRFRMGSNRANNAPYTVVYNGGTQTIAVNQTVGGGTWVLLGTFNFASGTAGYVRLDNGPAQGSKVVIADAVKFTPQ
ncbi:MAG TPA: hypothetical protein PKH07_05950, partial [bacterium]|nr:hypothetical protein [bacterium]